MYFVIFSATNYITSEIENNTIRNSSWDFLKNYHHLNEKEFILINLESLRPEIWRICRTQDDVHCSFVYILYLLYELMLLSIAPLYYFVTLLLSSCCSVKLWYTFHFLLFMSILFCCICILKHTIFHWNVFLYGWLTTNLKISV